MDRANSGAATGGPRPHSRPQRGRASRTRWAPTNAPAKRRRTINVIRWIETLVERTDGAFPERPAQSVWSADREAVPEGHPLAPDAAREEWLTRALNCTLALFALLALLPVMLLLALL